MFARWLYPLAALLLAISLIGLRRATEEVSHRPVVLPGEIPAVLYEPGEGFRPDLGLPETEPLPLIVLAHGFAGNKGGMSCFARALARAGYAVLAFDFRGHGENPTPFQFGFDAPLGGLPDDVASAVLFARAHPRYDGERVAVMGHSMGAGAVLNFATREPDVAAVVAVSGARAGLGPYPPPNVLLLFAAGDPASIRDAARRLGAQLAGLERLVLDRTYGDPLRGTAVRLEEVDGVDHWTILYSSEAARRVVAWLDRALEREGSTRAEGAPRVEPPSGDGRMPWVALGLVAALLLVRALASAVASLVPRIPLQDLSGAPAPALRLGVLALAHVVALFLLAGGDALARAEPARFLPLLGAGDLLAFFAASGASVWVWLARRGAASTAGLFVPGTWIGAALLAGAGYLVLGSLAQPLADLWLTPQRLGSSVLGALLALPYFASSELLLRGAGSRGVWLPIVGKLVTLVALVAGALLGLVSFVILLATAAFAVLLGLFEYTALCLSRHAPNPWTAALVQAAWTGWVLAAVFPLMA